MALRGRGRKFGGIGVVVKTPFSGRGRGLRLKSYLPLSTTRGAGRRRRRRRYGRRRRIRGRGGSILHKLLGKIPLLGEIF